MAYHFKWQHPKQVIFWGGTGQAIVNRPIVEHYGAQLVAIFDDTPGLKSPFSDVPIYEGWASFQKWIDDKRPNDIGFCIAIGNPHGRVRLKLHSQLEGVGLKPISLIHPHSFISDDAVIGAGVQIMAGAIIQPRVRIGRQCIVNTRASLDHEDILEDGSEVAPGATLCGNVTLKTNAWVCAGATVLPRITIGEDSIVGAGALVNKDVPNGKVVVGVPAKER